MVKYILFAGTTEGRVIAEMLAEKYKITVCVTTEYGDSIMHHNDNMEVLVGKLDQAAMVRLMKEKKPLAVLDATHPYAVIASENIQAACSSIGMEYVRVLRTTDRDMEDGTMQFDDLSSLVEYLKTTEGNIFSTLGAKEVPHLTAIDGYEERVWVRVLPMQASLDACTAAKIPPKHTICMQGPFSEELNVAMFRAADAKIMITKLTGRSGGFNEKINAAKKLGMQCCVIKRPEEKGVAFEEIIEKIKKGEL